MLVIPPVRLKLTGDAIGNSNLAEVPVPMLKTLLAGIPNSKPALKALVIVVWADALKLKKRSDRNISFFIRRK